MTKFNDKIQLVSFDIY